MDNHHVPDPPGYGLLRWMGIEKGTLSIDDAMLRAMQCPDIEHDKFRKLLYRCKWMLVIGLLVVGPVLGILIMSYIDGFLSAWPG